MRRLILHSFQSPGDVVMLTAAMRDLHAAAPGQFLTDVRTSADALFENNPRITRLQEGASGVESIDMHYPLVHQSNQRPYHFLHGYAQYLEERLGLRIPVTRFAGDIHLNNAEKQLPPPGKERGIPEHFWIIIAGGKNDFTAKWWNPVSYQKVVDHFRGRLQFVQCGEAAHWHPPLTGVIDLLGKTNIREFVRLMYHADGVVCPVTFAMHLAAAVETKPGRPRVRPCVVIAGGREPKHWEAYPQHQFLDTIGMLPCCAEGGCWKSRCQLVGDGDPKDHHDVCVSPVQVRSDLRIAKCMDMITPEDVIRRIEMYLASGMHRPSTDRNGHPETTAAATIPQPAPVTDRAAPASVAKTRNVLLEFRHGLGDAVQLTVVLRHLQHYYPSWNVDVAALVGKHSAYSGLCRQALILDRDFVSRDQYHQTISLEWHEARKAYADAPSTKPVRCLEEVFQLAPIRDLCRYQIATSPEAKAKASQYLARICRCEPNAAGRFPAVLIHYQGNTSEDKKNLPHEHIRDICDLIRRLNFVPVILDWDRRSPLVDQQHVFNPDAADELWGGIGTGDAEVLAALTEASSLMIGVDSGPLHVAGATTTPTIGVWTQHHPVHFFDLADNVIHLVPETHDRLVHEPAALLYFANHYQHRVYRQIAVELAVLTENLLTGEPIEQLANKSFLKQLRSRSYDQHYYDEHKHAGLDYLNFGEWQQQYGRWFVESLGLRGKRVLDVGCACGSILRGLGQAGAIVQGVELNEHMVQLGRTMWPDMAPLLFICDAVNLHLFDDASWDAIHTAQVAEHWKPQLVPHILEEFQRVMIPGGLLFCALDTEESMVREKRNIENEDPTHICIRPMRWWHEQLEAAGWQVCSAEFEPALRSHSESFLKQYEWDWFLARRR